MGIDKPGTYTYILDTPYLATKYESNVHELVQAISPIYIDWRIERDPQLSIEDEIFNSSVIEAMDDEVEWQDVLVAIEILDELMEPLSELIEVLAICRFNYYTHVHISYNYTYLEIYAEEDR